MHVLPLIKLLNEHMLEAPIIQCDETQRQRFATRDELDEHRCGIKPLHTRGVAWGFVRSDYRIPCLVAGACAAAQPANPPVSDAPSSPTPACYGCLIWSRLPKAALC